VQSLVAQRQLGLNSAQQKESLEHVASGSRINKAADDAAGLGISEKMRAQIRSVRQNVRNASDGISMVQVAEGGMNEISNILIRFRELAIQSASDTIGDVERGYIEKEVGQLKTEVDRIAGATEFNGKKMLNGEGEKLDIQVGQKNNPEMDRIAFDVGKLNVLTSALGVDGLTVANKESAQSSLDTIDNALNKLVENRAELGAMQNRLVSTVNNLNIYDENLSQAKSRIRDADMASETAELTKYNILSQAGVSVLGQANQNNMLALKLIG